MAAHTEHPLHVEDDINDYEVVATPTNGKAPYRIAGYIERRADAELFALAPKLADTLRDLVLTSNAERATRESHFIGPPNAKAWQDARKAHGASIARATAVIAQIDREAN